MTTQHATATYQEIIDLHTEEDTVSVIGIHTPSTRMPIAMLSGFWKQFNKFRYNGCSFSMVPAARLPTDPLQVSYSAGETGIDPRDNLNPILFHGCHGNDLGKILNQFYESGAVSGRWSVTPTTTQDNRQGGYVGQVKRFTADSPDITVRSSPSIEQNIISQNRVGDVQLDTLYYRALTDTTWKKSGPQSGLRIRGLHPLVYNVATTRSLGNSGVAISSSQMPDDFGTYDGASRNSASGVPAMSTPSDSAGSPSTSAEFSINWPLGANDVQGPQYTTQGGDVQFSPVADTPLYTPSTRPLGWMDTRLRDANGNVSVTGLNGAYANDSQKLSAPFISDKENYATVPKIFMGMLLLPRAYKTEQYFRCILTHSFSFKGFRGQSMTTDYVGDVIAAPGYWDLNRGHRRKSDTPFCWSVLNGLSPLGGFGGRPPRRGRLASVPGHSPFPCS